MLEARRLRVGYPGHLLFNNLDLRLHAGELVCFMGPNGAGKSTLIRTLAGLQQPLSGSIVYNDQAGSHKTQENLALVLTDHVRSIDITVLEVVSFGRYPYLEWNITLSKNDKMKIDHAIEQVNIGHLANKKLHQLSDGQLQMSMIARAIAQDTPMIILDEPTAHLDLNNRVEIMKLLRRLTRELNKAILVATHELDLALQTADTIWLTGRNEDIITGIPEDLVLDGSFDQTFRFKGFDLKTGKVQQDIFKNAIIKLEGKGHVYLWTKNALERNGYRVNTEKTNYEIRIAGTDDQPSWTLNDSKLFSTISELLHHLRQTEL
jgi:iron complex transport system ATP-binding protein